MQVEIREGRFCGVFTGIFLKLGHGMGPRTGREQADEMWIATADLARSPAHPFYPGLNELLEGEKFDEFVEGLCLA